MTQAKQGEQLVSMLPAFKNAFDLMVDDLVDLSSEKESLNYEIGSYNGKWLEESKARLLKQTDAKEKANLFMSTMPQQIKK